MYTLPSFTSQTELAYVKGAFGPAIEKFALYNYGATAFAGMTPSAAAQALYTYNGHNLKLSWTLDDIPPTSDKEEVQVTFPEVKAFSIGSKIGLGIDFYSILGTDNCPAGIGETSYGSGGFLHGVENCIYEKEWGAPPKSIRTLTFTNSFLPPWIKVRKVDKSSKNHALYANEGVSGAIHQIDYWLRPNGAIGKNQVDRVPSCRAKFFFLPASTLDLCEKDLLLFNRFESILKEGPITDSELSDELSDELSAIETSRMFRSVKRYLRRIQSAMWDSTTPITLSVEMRMVKAVHGAAQTIGRKISPDSPHVVVKNFPEVMGLNRDEFDLCLVIGVKEDHCYLSDRKGCDWPVLFLPRSIRMSLWDTHLSKFSFDAALARTPDLQGFQAAEDRNDIEFVLNIHTNTLMDGPRSFSTASAQIRARLFDVYNPDPASRGRIPDEKEASKAFREFGLEPSEKVLAENFYDITRIILEKGLFPEWELNPDLHPYPRQLVTLVIQSISAVNATHFDELAAPFAEVYNTIAKRIHHELPEFIA